MKKHFFFSFILIVLVLNACNRRSAHYSEISEFETVKEMQFVEHKVSVILGTPDDMLIMNDLVVILDVKNDKFFHVLSIDDYSFLGSFISKGRGPGEEVQIGPFFKLLENDKILYQSYHDLKIAKVLMSDSSLDIVIHDRYDLPTSVSMGSDFFIFNNYIFHSNNPYPASKDYYVLDIRTGEQSEWGEPIPLSDKKVHPDKLSAVSEKLTTVNLKENLIASVFGVLPILRIYCLENEKLIIERQMSDASHNLEFLLSSEPQTAENVLQRDYYIIKSTDDYIYALYIGGSVSNYFKEGEEPHYSDVGREIHIWKWDGTPVMKLVFDRPFFAFDVTTDNKKIIATSVVDVDKIFEAVIPWD